MAVDGAATRNGTTIRRPTLHPARQAVTICRCRWKRQSSSSSLGEPSHWLTSRGTIARRLVSGPTYVPWSRNAATSSKPHHFFMVTVGPSPGPESIATSLIVVDRSDFGEDFVGRHDP